MGRQQRGKKEDEDTVQVVDSLKEQHEEEQEDKNSDFTDSPDLSSQLNNEEDDNGDDGDYREQDRLLPIANVGRIMKLAVPPAAKISKEAKESVQECVSEFITFVSSEYSFLCVFCVLYILTHTNYTHKGCRSLSSGKTKDHQR